MTTITEIFVPDIGGATDVDVIEILVSPGDTVAKEDSLITLEGDKATMEIPSSYDGVIEELKLSVGDKVSEGSLMLTMKVEGEVKAEKPKQAQAPKKAAPSAPTAAPAPTSTGNSSDRVYASPSVRRLARELNINLAQVHATGPKGRVTKDDLNQFIKGAMAGGGQGISVAAAPQEDFSKYGEIETKPLNKIKKLTGANVHRSWVTVPHVTQFDECDITDMEAFRQEHKKAAEKKGFKLTPLAFVMKAVVAALQEFPHFNASLDASGENLIYKKYFHIGVAADTPNGLVVPVVRDVDQKGINDIAKELGEVSAKAREKGLSVADMSGSCFTVSSLGGIGGTAFTPIVKAPDVAILGVSKAQIKPVYQNGEFVPRLMLPLSLSYDHRVVDGADGARFLVYLSKCLSDIRSLLLH